MIELGPKAKAHPLVRFGLGAVLVFVAALFAIAAVVPYRNVSHARFVANTAGPRAPLAGRVHLRVHEGQLVHAGEPIAEIEPATDEITGIATLPPDVLASLRPPSPARLTLDTPSGAQKVPATIVALSPAAGGGVSIRLTTKTALPPYSRATLTVAAPEVPLLRQLLRRSAQ